MSDFRSRADEVKAAGVAARGNFEPTGVPLRIYKWWLKNAPGDKAESIRLGNRRENFCHFWRVVVFWAPILAVLLKAVDAVDFVVAHKPVQIYLAAFAAVLFGILCLEVHGVAYGLFIVLATVAAVGAVVGVITGIVKGIERLPRHARARLSDVLFIGFISLLGLIALFLIVLGIISTGWIGVAVLFGTIALISGLVWAGITVEGRLETKRELARQARIDYIVGHGELPPTPVKEPGRIKKFFSGVTDFLILAAQVIRVNKWKICPLVEVDTK